MSELTLAQVFGEFATQTATELVIKKSDLQPVGLTVAADNRAEQLFVAIFAKAKQTLNKTTQETNPDVQITIVTEKKVAIVKYSFADKELKRFETDKVPIDVITGLGDNTLSASVHFQQGFPGNDPESFNFTVNAPDEVPRNLSPKPDIYLISGLWDDYGTIGRVLRSQGVSQTLFHSKDSAPTSVKCRNEC